MNQMNQIVIEGNVVRDSSVRQTSRGTKVCVVPIASNHHYKDSKGETQNEVAYLDVQAWGENFSNQIVKMAKKGRGLRVVGRLKQDRWKTQEGKNTSKVYIIAEHIDFQFPKSDTKNESKEEEMAKIQAEGIKAESELTENELIDEGESVF